MSDFDVEGARKAGYSDAEIADHLEKSRGFEIAGAARKEGRSEAEIADYLARTRGFDIEGARKSGYSDSDIVGHLTSARAKAPETKSEPRTPVAASAVYQGRPMSVAQPEAKPTAAAPGGPPPKPWSDLPGNIPESAGNFVNALVHPILHPVDTAKAVGDIGMGVVSKGRALAQNVLGIPNDVNRPEVEKTADAAGNYLSDRFGSLRKIRNTVITDPVGAAADASMVLTGGGGLAARAPGIVGKVGEITSAAGRAIDPVTQSVNALRAGATGGAKLTGNVLGGTTGAGGRSVADAAEAGRLSVGKEGAEIAQTQRENIRGAPVDDVVSRFKVALDDVRKDAGAEYRSGMVDISKDRTILDFGDINKAVDGAGGVGKFKGANIAPAATETNDALRKVVKDWETLDPKSPLFKDVAPGELTAANFHTPEGLDALKRTIGNLRDATEARTPARVAADRVYNAVKKEIVAQAPAYGEIMKAYEKSADQIGEASRTLSLGEKASKDTAARKLLSATRNNAQTNYGGRQKMIDLLAEHDPTLPYAISGQALNSLAPRGLVGRGGLMALGGSMVANPGNALLAPFFSPRIVGEGAYYAGKGAGIAERGANALRITEENLRRAGRGSYQSGRLQEAQ